MKSPLYKIRRYVRLVAPSGKKTRHANLEAQLGLFSFNNTFFGTQGMMDVFLLGQLS
jgi:hypothetical protein